MGTPSYRVPRVPSKGVYVHFHISTYSHLVGKRPAAKGEREFLCVTDLEALLT